ncbi:MAG: hypothetical protein DHS20C19_05120 [Acidimicrobiales bacterium]|nr:MAG: hypothetical protein DHS20C19_05120 [Acidimicrobiales bacterium]
MTNHTVRDDAAAMKHPSTYEIVFRGHAGDRLLGRLRDDFSVDTTEDGNTRLVGEIRDPAHLHGVIHHLTSLAIEIVSLTSADNERS